MQALVEPTDSRVVGTGVTVTIAIIPFFKVLSHHRLLDSL